MSDLIRERLRQLAHESKSLTQSRRELNAAVVKQRKQWNLTEPLRLTTLALYVLARQCLLPVVVFLKRIGKRKNWDALDETALSLLVIDLFTAAQDSELMTLVDAGAHHDNVEMRTAYVEYLKWSTAMWVGRQNLKGIPIDTSLMLVELERRRLKVPPDARPASWGVVPTKGLARMCSRWRKTYGGYFGAMQALEKIPLPLMRAKATTAWQWFNHLASRIPACKCALRINMDETSVCMWQGNARGNIFVSKRCLPTQNVPRSTCRQYMTHLAFVCDDRELQLKLPQIIICNKHTLTASMHEELKDRCPSNVTIVVGESAWVNGSVIALAVRLLAVALRPYIGTVQPILMFDACYAHLVSVVWATLTRYSIWPLLVPAKLTWFMQPLDTHAFHAFKCRLRLAYQIARVRTTDGKATVADLFDSIFVAIREILETRSWANAFDRDGFSVGQTRVRKRKWRALGITAPVPLGSDRPTAEQLSVVFPKRRKVPFASLWRCVDRRETTCGDVLCDVMPDGPLAIDGVSHSRVSVSAAVLPADGEGAICTRTRSSGKSSKAW